MSNQTLHITNGTKLNTIIDDLKIQGEKLTWQELLCEGPTSEMVASESFLETRKDFFDKFYGIDLDLDLITSELDKLNHTKHYSEIVLWFDYDLFCHINMVAVISFIKQKKIELPIYLVCSGRVEGSKNLKSLLELNSAQLFNHYKNKVLLKKEDIDIATTVWGIYCGIDHNLLKPYIVKPSSFEYLSNCLKAHLERFPDSSDGLNNLERNILEIINKYSITSKNHLLGYALNYQGYYGYGDLQLSRIIDQLEVFYDITDEKIELNRKGHEAILAQHNFALEIDNGMIYGGVKKIEFQFSKPENKLIKSATNAH
ncbi:MAG: DUF1835 domain-containing protein [Algibacter sp.]|uniref:DUF1835 domain-containing protein n=1 Tax=Algibacter sp. TaxID=1872428 RepID=UPI00261AC731|nr:DUF1835 domain-containing protein [Algibacter sp.]MDG1729531.1 DUF1835 domain-containing protein [Algibacter sp.]MDG2177725.1 DUF1835 domain-containing protein [Algibacter sp.]